MRCVCGHPIDNHTSAGCVHAPDRGNDLFCSCTLDFELVKLSNGGIDLSALPDDEWEEHEGYPRDRTDAEQKQWERLQAQMEQVASSSSIDIDRLGGIRRTIFEGSGAMSVGDKVALRSVDGKVRKAKLGETYVGTVQDVDYQTGLVTVRMNR